MRTRGFIALTSVLIISVVLLGIVATASMKSLFARFDALEYEEKAQSASLAESCAAIAQLRIIANPDYAGNEIVTIDNDTCTIGSVHKGRMNTLFTVSADYHHAVTVYDEAVPN